MLAMRKPFWAVLLVVFFGFLRITPTIAQSPSLFIAAKTPANVASPGDWRAKCGPPRNTPPNLRQTDETGSAAFVMADESNAAGTTNTACSQPAIVESAGNPCRTNAKIGSRLPGIPIAFSCAEGVDPVPGELAAFGKAGLKIAQAREGVVDILRSENACSEWFESRDATPAATFQSLRFSLDRRGPQDVFELKQSQFRILFRQPYVARATQDGGGYTTVTINAYGAFFRSRGNVHKETQEGGPQQMDGTRLLNVGSYSGDTLPAQMATLLHEFGHIVDLLPEETDDLEGKSVENTNEVLSHCRTEIEARWRLSKQMAKR
jgi:hypothetical protein